MRVEQQNHRLIIHDGRSECWIDPWGKDSLRVRMSAGHGRPRLGADRTG